MGSGTARMEVASHVSNTTLNSKDGSTLTSPYTTKSKRLPFVGNTAGRLRESPNLAVAGIGGRSWDSRDERRAPRRRRGGREAARGRASAAASADGVGPCRCRFRSACGRGSSDEGERGRALFARSLPSSLPPCSTDCNFQSSESKSGILSSPIESTNFEERKRGRKRKRKKGAAVVREEEEEEMGK